MDNQDLTIYKNAAFKENVKITIPDGVSVSDVTLAEWSYRAQANSTPVFTFEVEYLGSRVILLKADQAWASSLTVDSVLDYDVLGRTPDTSDDDNIYHLASGTITVKGGITTWKEAALLTDSEEEVVEDSEDKPITTVEE